MEEPILPSTPINIQSVPLNSTPESLSANIDTILASDESFSVLSIVIGLVALLMVLYFALGKKKSGTQNLIALIGQRYSGKTQLFMRLNGAKIFDTVPSIKNNQTSFKMSSSRKTYQMTDFTGDGISKDEILHEQNYGKVHTLIQVIDGTDPTKLGDAALFMYRLLVNKQYQKRECNYVVLLNKSESENFLTRGKLVKRLEDEIEHIKQSRKNSAEELEEEEDYLKGVKERFELEKSGVKVVVGAVRGGEIKELERVLDEIL